MRRKRLNLKQVDVGDMMGVSQGYVSQLETQIQPPTQENLEALAEALQADPDDLRLGRVPLSWFGAVYVPTREELIHTLAVMEGLSDDVIEDGIATAKRAIDLNERHTTAERLADDDPQLLRVVDTLQTMPRGRLYRLLRSIEAEGDRDG
jgi:transcriptional regulator with XRE-family HTH domain